MVDVNKLKWVYSTVEKSEKMQKTKKSQSYETALYSIRYSMEEYKWSLERILNCGIDEAKGEFILETHQKKSLVQWRENLIWILVSLAGVCRKAWQVKIQIWFSRH